MRKQSFQIAAAALGLFVSAAAVAQTQLPVTRQILDRDGQGFPGSYVAMSGEWAAVGNISDCAVDIYRFDYVTGLWGNGTINGIPFQALREGGSCQANENRLYGAAVALRDGVLVVGAPRAKVQASVNEIGAFYLYRYDDAADTWTREHQVFQPSTDTAPPQVAARFGASVALDGVEGNPDLFMIIIGAPTFDGPGGTNSGAAFSYYWLANSPQAPIPIFRSDGENPGDNYGDSLAANGDTFPPRYAVGAPNHEASILYENEGAVYVWELLQQTPGPKQKLTREDFQGGSPSDVTWSSNWLAGIHVAMSGEYLLVSGLYSYTMRDDPATPAIDYTLTQRISTSGGAGSTFYRDLAIADGLKAYGIRNLSLIGIYREEAITRDAIGYALPFESDSTFSSSIDIDGARLIVNGEPSDRAYAYTFPCGGDFDRVQNMVWKMVSIPCAAPSRGYTVNQVFGELGTLNTDYQVWEQNRTDWSGRAAANVKLNFGDPVYQDRSYWLIWRNINFNSAPEWRWAVDKNVGAVSTPIQTAFADTPAFGDVAGHVFLTSVGIGTLPTGTENGGEPVSVMLGNPFPRSFDASRILVSNANTGLVTLGSPTSKLYVEDAILWVYDTVNPDIPSGQNYRAVVATATPGFSATIEPYQGFWLKLLPAATQPSLLIPLEK
jgi:hypothetical protein